MDKTQDDLDLYFLTRNVQWRYRLDQYEDATIAEMLKTVRSAVAEIKREIFDGDAPQNADALVAELEALSAGLRRKIGEDVATMSGVAAEYSAAEHAAIMSLDGAVKINTVALSAAQFQSFLGGSSGGTPLPQWVDDAWGHVVSDKIKRNLNIAVLRGEGYQKAVRGLLDSAIADFTEREAISIARTYIQTANVAAQMAVYQANDDLVKGWKWSAVLEAGYSKSGRGTCLRCASLDSREFKLGEGPPIPLHCNCRCVAIGITKSWRELGIDRDEIEQAIRPYTIRPDANIDAGGMRTIIESGRHQGDYASWWAKQSKEFRVNAVGPGRFELLESGRIEFGDLIDDTGRQRSIPELNNVASGKLSKKADVIYRENARSLGLDAPLKIEKWGPDLSLTTVKVEYIPRVGSVKFDILKDGTPVIYGDPIWGQNMAELNRQKLMRSVQEFLSPLEDDVFIRVTNKKEDYAFLKDGTHHGSKNWATGETEYGLSVAKSPEFSGKYAYYVRGRQIADGSDGEPVLDVASARPVGKLMQYDKLADEYKSALYAHGKKMGLTEQEIRALLTSKRAFKK